MSARNAELETAIVEEPDAPDGYLVYGDWLLEQGDPLGELVSVQAKLAKLEQRAGNAREKAALTKRAKLLLADAEAQLGALAKCEHTWSLGFLESLVLSNPSVSEYDAILAAPVARFLRELDVDDIPSVRDGAVASRIVGAISQAAPPTLRKLALLQATKGGQLGFLPAALWTTLARLGELTIRAGSFTPEHIDLPKLEALALTTRVTDRLLTTLDEASCPNLASFYVEAVSGELGAPTAITGTRLRPLFQRWARQGTLRHLAVIEHDMGDEVVAALFSTSLVEQLTSLDLSRARLTDAGGSTILRNAAALGRLESLNLSENELSEAMTRALERAFDLVVDVEEQGSRYDEES